MTSVQWRCAAIAAASIAALTLLLANPSTPQQSPPAFVPPAAAEAGDLIFRQGTEVISEAVMLADGGGFSHVGMLVGSAGHWQVLHSTPPEVPGRPDGVVIDTLEFFTAPERSRHQVVYHVQAGAQQRSQAILNAQAQAGRPFRMADPAGTYCTQLVWLAWQNAGLDLQVQPTHLQLPFIAGDYLLPGDLRASPRLRELTANLNLD